MRRQGACRAESAQFAWAAVCCSSGDLLGYSGADAPLGQPTRVTVARDSLMSASPRLSFAGRGPGSAEAPGSARLLSYGNPLSESPRSKKADIAAVQSFDGDPEMFETDVDVSPPSVCCTAEPGHRAKMNRMLQISVFGTAADQHEIDFEQVRIREEALRNEWFGLLHPQTKQRHAYDIAQVVVMVYLAWVLPTRMAFDKAAVGWGVIVDIMVDISVYIDMGVSMNTYTFDKKSGELITDKKKVKRAYMRSWFFVDLFSVFPLDQVMLLVGNLIMQHGTNDHMIEMGFHLVQFSISARMLRLLRLLRLVKLKQMINIDMVIQQLLTWLRPFGVVRLQLEAVFNVLFLLAVLIAAGHFLGCVWLMLGRYSCLYLLVPQGWMVQLYTQHSCSYDSILVAPPNSSGFDSAMQHNCPIDYNRTRDYVACTGGTFSAAKWNDLHGLSCQSGCAPIPEQHAHEVDCTWIRSKHTTIGADGDADYVGASESRQYTTAFYFVLVTISTVGYGDIAAYTQSEQQFVIAIIVMGAFIYAFIIGEFSSLINNMNREKSDFDAKMRKIQGMLGYIQAPDDLFHRVVNFYGRC